MTTKKIISFVLVFIIVMSTVSANAFAADAITKTELDIGTTKFAYVRNVDDKGESLLYSKELMASDVQKEHNVIIRDAHTNDNQIIIIGEVDGQKIEISGKLCAVSENKNVLVFEASEISGKFRVAYCAIEKNIRDSSLFFKDFANENPKFNVAIKLYLVDNLGKSNSYYMIECFGNKFPEMSDEYIRDLPADSELNMYWYAKEFKPITFEVKTIGKEISNGMKAGNPSYILLAYYEFSNLGITDRHYLRYTEDCDIRNVPAEGTSSAGATLTVTQKWISSDLTNNNSSTTSTLSLRNISLIYSTRSNTAVYEMSNDGSVTRSGIILTNFSIDVGWSLSGLSVTPSLSFSYDFPTGAQNISGTIHYTNSAGKYWRAAEAVLDSSCSLNAINNYFCASWEYAAYTSVTSTANAQLIFKYDIYNLLDYTASTTEEDARTISVSITN